jgi:hypothetical protein
LWSISKTAGAALDFLNSKSPVTGALRASLTGLLQADISERDRFGPTRL